MFWEDCSYLISSKSLYGLHFCTHACESEADSADRESSLSKTNPYKDFGQNTIASETLLCCYYPLFSWYESKLSQTLLEMKLTNNLLFFF
jgi:hypothetical protein